MLRLCLLAAALLSVAAACSTSNVSEPDDPALDVRAAADDIIAAINARAYAEVYDLVPSECLGELTPDQLASRWSQFAEAAGDPNFRLEITQFEVDSVTEDRAEVTAQVVAHTATRDIPMGTTEDPFFGVFIREDGVWKAGDPADCP
jgi:hypothetical protein